MVAAVAKSMLGSGTGSADEAELEAGDLDLLQRLSDSGTDVSVLQRIAESKVRRGRGAGRAEAEASTSGERPLPMPSLASES